MIRVRGLFIATLLALGIGASAQTGSGFKMPSLWYNPALLFDPAVVKDLNLSQAEATKATQAMIKVAMKMMPMAKSAMNGKTPTPAEAKTASETLQKMEEESVKDLTPAQRDRLHQISLQSYGAKALLDPRVGAQVGITPAQHKSLQAALFAITQRSSNGQAPNMTNMQQTAAKNRALGDAALAKILSAKQMAKWKAAQGKPITLGPLAGMMGF